MAKESSCSVLLIRKNAFRQNFAIAAAATCRKSLAKFARDAMVKRRLINWKNCLFGDVC